MYHLTLCRVLVNILDSLFIFIFEARDHVRWRCSGAIGWIKTEFIVNIFENGLSCRKQK